MPGPRPSPSHLWPPAFSLSLPLSCCLAHRGGTVVLRAGDLYAYMHVFIHPPMEGPRGPLLSGSPRRLMASMPMGKTRVFLAKTILQKCLAPGTFKRRWNVPVAKLNTRAHGKRRKRAVMAQAIGSTLLHSCPRASREAALHEDRKLQWLLSSQTDP